MIDLTGYVTYTIYSPMLFSLIMSILYLIDDTFRSGAVFRTITVVSLFHISEH